MDADFGSSYITIEDEEGNEFELEQLATLEYEGKDYSAFLPADMDENDPEYGYIILRIDHEDGEELFCSVDDEEELVAVYNRFMDVLFEDEDEEDEDEEDEEELDDEEDEKAEE